MPVYVYPAVRIVGEPEVYVEALKEATCQMETTTDEELRGLLKQSRILPPVPWSREKSIQALAHCFASNTEFQLTSDSIKCCVIS